MAAACGSSSSPGPSGTGGAAPANTITVNATDHGYTVSGTVRPGTATITFSNHTTVTHSMNAVQLKPGITLSQVTAALAPGGNPDSEVAGLTAEPPGPATDTGTPGMVGPGRSITVTALDLAPGAYAVADFLVGSNGRPYYTQGFLDEFHVGGATLTTTPASAGPIDLGDTAARFPVAFNGNGTYKVTNIGTHEISIAVAQLDAGTSLSSYFRYVAPRRGHQPVDGGGGVIAGTITNLRPGQSVYVDFHLTPGSYAYIEPPQGQPTGPAPNGTLTVS